MSLTKATYSMIEGAPLNVLDYGAVADGNFSGGAPSGTDNLAAFAAALTAAVTTNINAVYVPAGSYYLSGKITIPRGVTLFGVGMAHMPVWKTGSNRRGTVLLIAGASGDDCVAYDATLNSGHTTLRNITIAHVGSVSNRSVVYIVNHLYPNMENVELYSLVKSTGAGLYIYGSTLWGNFDNIVAVADNVNLSNEYSFRYALQIYGVTPDVTVPNANSFRAGHFAGTWAAAYFDGAAGDTGGLSNVFHGTKFDLNWNGTAAPVFLANGDGLFDYPLGPVYITPVVHVAKGHNTAFHGCYFEAANEPATYDDGVNGSHDLVPVFLNEDATFNTGTGVLDCNWNNTFPYDVATNTLMDPTTGGYRHSSRFVPMVTIRQTTPQSIPNTTWTTVNFNTVLFGDTSHLEYDAAADTVVCRTAGTYMVSAQVAYAGWATTPTIAQMRAQTTASGGITFQGDVKRELGAGVPIIVQQTFVLNMVAGDTVKIETFHNQGAPQNTEANFSLLSVVQI
ncbi:Pectate lyase superfamily protein [uncultured Caudovirales phage]|uniref:Pectate lyase superfamily protein n=1 Tax=uncultured Caudovirales phage TaxID=2100421 RepID=A0A6J5M184_9CAUD|nr:Pectate lyase superfamily protein [uncultured Caudovirales phage]